MCCVFWVLCNVLWKSLSERVWLLFLSYSVLRKVMGRVVLMVWVSVSIVVVMS